ncbi:MAG: hypothetical protein ACKVUT_17290 [Gaiella sp.]
MSSLLAATPLALGRTRYREVARRPAPTPAADATFIGGAAVLVRFHDGRLLTVEHTSRGWLAYTQGLASSVQRHASLAEVLERSAVRRRDLQPAQTAVLEALRAEGVVGDR